MTLIKYLCPVLAKLSVGHRCVGARDGNKSTFDFKDIVIDQCQFLNRCLKILLSPKLRNVDHDFVVDMRTFKNFGAAVNDVNVNVDVDADDDEAAENVLVITEQFMNECSEFLEVSTTIADFLEQLDNRYLSQRSFPGPISPTVPDPDTPA